MSCRQPAHSMSHTPVRQLPSRQGNDLSSGSCLVLQVQGGSCCAGRSLLAWQQQGLQRCLSRLASLAAHCCCRARARDRPRRYQSKCTHLRQSHDRLRATLSSRHPTWHSWTAGHRAHDMPAGPTVCRGMLAAHGTLQKATRAALHQRQPGQPSCSGTLDTDITPVILARNCTQERGQLHLIVMHFCGQPTHSMQCRPANKLSSLRCIMLVTCDKRRLLACRGQRHAGLSGPHGTGPHL